MNGNLVPPSVVTVNEQTFTSPGTWTWPGNVKNVEVLLVGGGGGGGTSGGWPQPSWGGGGGGGAVRTRVVAVSGPVPVTVGAGGAGGPNPGGNGQTGGTSAFGPLGPGPIPAIPEATAAAGGGGFGAGGPGGPPIAAHQNGGDAPSIGGGGGGGWGFSGGPPNPQPVGSGVAGMGRFGSPGLRGATFLSGPNPSFVSTMQGGTGGGAGPRSASRVLGGGLFGYGAGGITDQPGGGLSYPEPIGRGGRGSGPGTVPNPSTDKNGGNGLVIVRWYE
jgi:hypothetical protein